MSGAQRTKRAKTEEAGAAPAADILQRARKDLLLGGAVAALLLIGGGAWAAFTPLAGAVIAPASLTLKSNVKSIQPPIGGVVADIPVHEGQAVPIGALLLRLDDTVAKANLAIVSQQIDELEARRARLKAEAGLASGLFAPPNLAQRWASEPALAPIWDGEQRLLTAREEARAGQKSQLAEQTAQLKEQIGGLTLQAEAKAKEIKLIGVELEGMEQLAAKNLISISRATAVRREAARLEGELGQLRASIAAARGRIAEISIQILSIDQAARSDAATELRDVEAKLAELRERQVAARDQLSRMDVVAPTAGVVHDLMVHTLRSYVGAGDTVMKLVPRDDQFVVSAQVDPTDVDQVHRGQEARLRFSAFQQETTPEISGIVSQVSADVSIEERSGRHYYRVEVTPDPAGLATLDKDALVAGMPIEVHLRTTSRTPLSYLLKPLDDQLSRAFRGG